MDNIIALIKNQFNTLMATKKSMMLIVAFAVGFVIMNPSAIPWAAALVIYLFVMQVISYEYRSGIDSMVSYMPVKASEYILSRYLFAIISVVMAVIVGALLLMGIGMINPSSIPHGMTYSSIILSIVGFATVVIGVVLPVMIIVGPDKARLIIIGLTVLPLVIILSIFGEGNGEILNKIATLDMNTGIIIGIIGMILLIGSSYFITLKIYSKKEI